jgi:hypothetical protein
MCGGLVICIYIMKEAYMQIILMYARRMHHGHLRLKVCGKNKQKHLFKQWIFRQISAERKGTLTCNHKRMLEGIGFTWKNQGKNREKSHCHVSKKHKVSQKSSANLREKDKKSSGISGGKGKKRAASLGGKYKKSTVILGGKLTEGQKMSRRKRASEKPISASENRDSTLQKACTPK